LGPGIVMSNPSDRIVLHIAGQDRPGVTAKLAEITAAEKAQLVDVGQSVLHGYLMLTAIIDIPPESNALRRILFAVNDLGLRVEISPFEDNKHRSLRGKDPRAGLCVTLLGDLRSGAAIAALTSFMADREMNIRDIRSLSEDGLTGLELILDLPRGIPTEKELSGWRGELLTLGRRVSVDMAVQKDDLFRRSKRMVCLDVDSTFVKGELIDDLAELVGCKAAVAEITARAMSGELDFGQALEERVSLLTGLEVSRAEQLCTRFELNPGAERFVRTLKCMGIRVGLVSGGFDFFVGALRDRFGLDFSFANELEVDEGRFTGRILGTVVDGERKAQVLRDMAEVYKCRLEQTVAIGDGANDMRMLQAAGLGIAYRGKPTLQRVADMSLIHNEGMDALLFLMGFSARDLRGLPSDAGGLPTNA
jgi:phosphoserine phosphatase